MTTSELRFESHETVVGVLKQTKLIYKKRRNKKKKHI